MGGATELTQQQLFKYSPLSSHPLERKHLGLQTYSQCLRSAGYCSISSAHQLTQEECLGFLNDCLCCIQLLDTDVFLPLFLSTMQSLKCFYKLSLNASFHHYLKCNLLFLMIPPPFEMPLNFSLLEPLNAAKLNK